MKLVFSNSPVLNKLGPPKGFVMPGQRSPMYDGNQIPLRVSRRIYIFVRAFLVG